MKTVDPLESSRRWKREHRDPAAHAEAERARYYTRRGLPVPPKRVRVRVPRPVLVPLIDVPTGHPLYDEARELLTRSERHELGGDMDAAARDLLQTYVLARLEGHDPLAAVKAIRRRIAQDRRLLIHGLSMVDGLER